jgi:hypothetical protein
VPGLTGEQTRSEPCSLIVKGDEGLYVVGEDVLLRLGGWLP